MNHDPSSKKRSDEALDRLLDRHPRLHASDEFTDKVVRSTREEAARSRLRVLGPSPRRRSTWWLAGMVATAAAFLLWGLLEVARSGSEDGRGVEEQPPVAEIEAPPEELLRDLDVLMDLDLLLGEEGDEALALLLDVEDVGLLEESVTTWMESEEGGD